MTELGDQRCAQPICRHRRKEHLDGADGHDHHCTLCPCSAYVSGPRMVGSRLSNAVTRSEPGPGNRAQTG